MRRWVGTPEELRALICEQRDAVDVSHETLDFISGLPNGYVSKLLAPHPIKNFGPESLRALLGALALRIVRIEIAVDPQAAVKVSGRWVRRKRRPNRKEPEPEQWCVVSHPQTLFDYANMETDEMSKDKMIGVRVDAELDARLKAAADKDRRKVGDFVRLVLSDALDEPEQSEKPEVAA
jgi:hypothetical protein